MLFHNAWRISDYHFKNYINIMIAFSDNAGATEKNECIQKLNEPVSFLLLNDGEEIEID